MGKTKDLSGQRIGKLTVLYRLEGQTRRRYSLWRCRCDCGKEIDLSRNELLYTNIISCGCGKADWGRKLANTRPLVDGTAIDALKSAAPRSSSTGYKGVCLSKGKYLAHIRFKNKRYYLGRYSDIKDALEARAKAEKLLFHSTIDYYDRWCRKAGADPEWAKLNPIEILVTRDPDEGLALSFSPELPEESESGDQHET